MRILKTNNENPDKEVIEEAINVMAHGGVVLYPTDTVYGLGVNIFNKKAVRRIYDIKKRSLMKPLSIIVSSKDAISHVANLRTRDKIYVDKFLPGPYTLILNKTKIVPRVVTSGLKHVGVRIPDNEIACRISDLFPVTTTSANLSDHEVCETPDEEKGAAIEACCPLVVRACDVCNQCDSIVEEAALFFLNSLILTDPEFAQAFYSQHESVQKVVQTAKTLGYHQELLKKIGEIIPLEHEETIHDKPVTHCFS